MEVFSQGGHIIHCRERNTQTVPGLWQLMPVRKTFGSPQDACSALTICNRCQLCPFQLWQYRYFMISCMNVVLRYMKIILAGHNFYPVSKFLLVWSLNKSFKTIPFKVDYASFYIQYIYSSHRAEADTPLWLNQIIIGDLLIHFFFCEIS